MQSRVYDLVLTGGHVIDPDSDTSAPLDVAIAGGRIARIGRPIDGAEARQTVDVSGLYVVPGLIDMHVHLDPRFYAGGLVADAHSFSSGVTTMVDTGSAGANTFWQFKEWVIDRSKTRVLAFLNVVDAGMTGEAEQDVSRMRPLLAAGVARANPDHIVGIKVAHYWTWQPYDAGHGPWDNVDRGIEAGELCGLPLMVDFWPRPERPYEELILKKMRPGDIHTHVFAQQFPIILPDGCVNPALLKAQERGIIFDVGHGAGSFWFRNAVPALQQGFVPASISSDLHVTSINGLPTNLLGVMSKFLNMGMTLEDVIQRVTTAPAAEIGHPELGTLRVGAEADVAVLALERGEFAFIDCGRARLRGDRRLRCALTLRAGEVAYDPQGMTMPDWEQAPASYWGCKQPTGPTDWERPPASY